MNNNEPIQVGVVGLGRSGWNIHIRTFRNMTDKFRVVAVCDINEARLEEAKTSLGCKTYARYEDFLGDQEIELVVVATPTYLHPPYSIMALKSGKKVVCEKPMATTTKDADEMIRVSKETGSLLTVFQNRRYGKDHIKVKEVIASGKLGRIVQIRMTMNSFGRRWDWQTLKEFGGGSLNNNGIHLLDRALQLMSEKEPEVFCHLDRALTLGDADDHVKIILKAPGEPLVDIELTSACAYPIESWLVMGTCGTLIGTPSELKWKYIKPEELSPRAVDKEPTPDRSYNREDLHWYEETWKEEDSLITQEMAFYTDLYRTIREGAPLAVKPEEVRKRIAIIEKCHKMNNL
ncbi:MAG TPA: Gfo/Idh/MocA family oxidoreductase [bacterium]|nr:Gfo/Idh/MocA family oxidoreductase [bacterium]